MTGGQKARPLPPDTLAVGRPPCADRVEVDRDVKDVPAATVRAWIEHLRSHGWTDKDFDPVWMARARQGVSRWDDSDRGRALQPTPSQDRTRASLQAAFLAIGRGEGSDR